MGHKDKYKWTLAYVVFEDGTFLNAEIVKQGYGHAYTRFPFKYLDEFSRYEQEARGQGRGLWWKSTGNGNGGWSDIPCPAVSLKNYRTR